LRRQCKLKGSVKRIKNGRSFRSEKARGGANYQRRDGEKRGTKGARRSNSAPAAVVTKEKLLDERERELLASKKTTLGGKIRKQKALTARRAGGVSCESDRGKAGYPLSKNRRR